MAEQFLSPHSFDHLVSIGELRQAATRPSRLRAALSDPSLLASLSPACYDLAYNDVLPDVQVAQLPPILLPGGRWLLSFAITENPTSYVICWDTQSASTSNTLNPAAYLVLEDLFIEPVKRSWAQVQFDAETGSVIIAARFAATNDRDTRCGFNTTTSFAFPTSI